MGSEHFQLHIHLWLLAYQLTNFLVHLTTANHIVHHFKFHNQSQDEKKIVSGQGELILSLFN